MTAQTIQDFIQYCQTHLRGDEKGEAQIFLDRFFVMLGYPEGIKGAGAECEFRLRNVEGKRSVAFADLFWRGRVLLEMKSQKEYLDAHFAQALNYWNSLTLNDKPRYIILCNFKEFWIYDLNVDIHKPADKIALNDLATQQEAFSFLLPHAKRPLFQLNQEEVTKEVAWYVAMLFRSLKARKIVEKDALHFCLQCVVAMFAEDVKLLPNKLFTRLLKDCEAEGAGKVSYEIIDYSYELIIGLFREMNEKGFSPGRIFKDVPYFNGGLFASIPRILLTKQEIDYLLSASKRDWAKVNPAIFGSIFERGMNEADRHKFGAHFTYETDIQRVIYPTISAPWREKITEAEEKFDFDNLRLAKAYYQLLLDLRNYKVLDPACGSGNFLFVAYRTLKRIEQELLKKILELPLPDSEFAWVREVHTQQPYLTTKQFFGMDTNEFAVELAKVTLTIAHQLSVQEVFVPNPVKGKKLSDWVLPLDNLDINIIQTDALFTEWIEADVIVGNPPFQSKNKMQMEFGKEYVSLIRAEYPSIPGHADYCVYWFYKAHNQLKANTFAGLIGTNTIRQNYSREGGLDYIVNNGGTIISAVSTQEWEGEANVSISIVAWKKGEFKGKKKLYIPNKQGILDEYEVDFINSSLSLNVDVTGTKTILANIEPKTCFQGQTHGYEGFLLSIQEGKNLIKDNPQNKEKLIPFLIGDELVGNRYSQPKRYLIDFSENEDAFTIYNHPDLANILKEKVYPEIEKKAIQETQTGKSGSRVQHFKRWWQVWAVRKGLLENLRTKKRYIACSRVMLRPVFEFISTEIRPNDKVVVFALDDYYSFGIILSNIHWLWIKEKCTTLENRFNYNLTIWESFPFPQNPTEKQVKKVADLALKIHKERNLLLFNDAKLTLREIYKVLESEGKSKLKDLYVELDKAVLEAYQFSEKQDLLTQLLNLNLQVADNEANGAKVQAPGLPDFITDKSEFITDDCVKFVG
ncbi:MAG: N-6 DNA methylase [Microscillaceae bacterium]|jgi:hypothetical protein|nr:N-6 DNA methylase [Microscillaceae bacterium]